MKLRYENKENINEILYFAKINLMNEHETYRTQNSDFNYKWFYDITMTLL